MTQIPSLDLDPFSIEFFENPHPVHEVLREAGPVVRLDKWNVYGVARYAEVHAVLNDPQTFCSSRGVGIFTAPVSLSAMTRATLSPIPALPITGRRCPTSALATRFPTSQVKLELLSRPSLAGDRRE